MAGLWRHNGAWIWDLLNPDNPAWPAGRDVTPWFGPSLLWDGVTGNADPGVFASDPQRLGGFTAGFDISGASAGVLPPAMPAQTIALADLADLPVTEVTPPVPNDPSPPVEPPLPPVTSPNTLPVNEVMTLVPASPPVEPPVPPVTPPDTLPVNQVSSLSPDASLALSASPQQLTGVPPGTDPTFLIPNH